MYNHGDRVLYKENLSRHVCLNRDYGLKDLTTLTVRRPASSGRGFFSAEFPDLFIDNTEVELLPTLTLEDCM